MSASPLRRPSDAQSPLPWWRFGMAWFVFGLPVLVVMASLVTAVIAWRHADTQVFDPPAPRPQVATGAGGIAPAPAPAPAPRPGPLEPAQQARNHAATPKP